MPTESVSVLVAKAPGRVCDGLCSLLSHQPHIMLMGVVQEGQAFLKRIRAGAGPGVVLLDTDLAGPGTLDLFQRLRQEMPQVRCILLVDTFEQQAQALSAGAGEILIKGFSADELLAAIRQAAPANPAPAGARDFAAPDGSAPSRPASLAALEGR